MTLTPDCFKGCQRIVLEEIARMLQNGQRPSVIRLVSATGYAPKNVWISLQRLRSAGVLEMHQPKHGGPAEYTILTADGEQP